MISISKSVENNIISTLKIPVKRSHLLENAIPLKEIKKPIKKTQTIELLFVGRLEKQKSIEKQKQIKTIKKQTKTNKKQKTNKKETKNK